MLRRKGLYTLTKWQLAFPYVIRVVRSVSNLTRRDEEEFQELAPRVPVRTEISPFPLSEANAALDTLRKGLIRDAAVIVVDQ